MKTACSAATRPISTDSRARSGATGTIPASSSGRIANEEFSVQNTPAGGRVAATMQTSSHRLDPTRPVTYAAPVGNDYPGINDVIEVRGWNYHSGRTWTIITGNIQTSRKSAPNRAAPSAPAAFTPTTPTRGYVSAYDEQRAAGRNTAETLVELLCRRPWLSGGFVWTGFDYRGEPTPYGWPCINSHFGILDTCGFPKDNFYYYQSWWTDQPVLHLLPHWNWPGKEGQEIDVRVLQQLRGGRIVPERPKPRPAKR